MLPCVCEEGGSLGEFADVLLERCQKCEYT